MERREWKYILDDQKNPIPCPDVIKWAEWMEDSYGNSEKRLVAKFDLGWCYVSTVFLGLDHGICSPGDPILYETMVFVNEDVPREDCRREFDLYQRRYTSNAAAIAGHAQIVDALIAGNYTSLE